MERLNCQMCHFLGSKKYCDYYDIFFQKCDNIEICPDGLDEESEYNEEYCNGDLGEWE